MKEFITAARRLEDEDVEVGHDVPFSVDGREIVAHAPTSSQFTLFMAAAVVGVSDADAIATSINFLFELLEPEDQRYLKRRLLVRNDDFGAEEIAEILSFLIEEWSGERPTKPSSASANSRSRGTQSSTAKRRAGASTR